MPSDLEHLQLTEKLFRGVVEHLRQRIQRLQESGSAEAMDLVREEQTPLDQSTVTALRLEVCLYSLCVDWARQQCSELQGSAAETQRHARENFYRLMATRAQAELVRDAHGRSFGLSSQTAQSQPLTDAQMFTALNEAADRQLATLIAL